MRVSGNAGLKNTLWEPPVYFYLSLQVTSQMLQHEIHKEQINDLCNNAKFHHCFHTGCFIPSLVFSPTLSKLIKKTLSAKRVWTRSCMKTTQADSETRFSWSLVLLVLEGLFRKQMNFLH